MQNIPDYEMTKRYTPYYFQVQHPGGEGFNYSTKTGQVAGRKASQPAYYLHNTPDKGIVRELQVDFNKRHD